MHTTAWFICTGLQSDSGTCGWEYQYSCSRRICTPSGDAAVCVRQTTVTPRTDVVICGSADGAHWQSRVRQLHELGNIKRITKPGKIGCDGGRQTGSHLLVTYLCFQINSNLGGKCHVDAKALPGGTSTNEGSGTNKLSLEAVGIASHMEVQPETSTWSPLSNYRRL